MTVDFAALADTLPAEKELDPDTAAAIDDVLDMAAAWEAGDVPTPEALAFVLATPRLIGTAFRHAWDDDRRPALERLHCLEYDHRYSTVMTRQGRIPRWQMEQIERHMASPDFEHLRFRKAS